MKYLKKTLAFVIVSPALIVLFPFVLAYLIYHIIDWAAAEVLR